MKATHVILFMNDFVLYSPQEVWNIVGFALNGWNFQGHTFVGMEICMTNNFLIPYLTCVYWVGK